MDEHTVEGAIAAGTYFVQLYPYIYATGDLSEWNKLSDEGCGFCTGARDHVAALHGSGGFVRGGKVEIYADDGGGPYEGGVFAVELGVRFADSTDVHGDGSTEAFSGAEFPEFSISLEWENDGWLVTGVVPDREGSESS